MAAPPPSSMSASEPPPIFTTLERIADLVHDGDRIGVGGTLFCRLPIAIVRAVCHAGRKDLQYISWGGGMPLEMLLAAQAVRGAMFCFSSLDVFGLAPLFRKAVEEKAIEIQDWTALGMIQGFHAAQHRVGSLPFVIPSGSELIERSGFAVIHADAIDGTPVASVPALPLDVLLLHAQRADEDGNVELQGAKGLDLSCVGAARNVLVTVEERLPRGAFAGDRRGAILPRTLIRAIAHCPGGAYPSSCLPYYCTDYRALFEATAHTPVKISLPKEERLTFVSKAAEVSASQVQKHPWHVHRREQSLPVQATIDEQLVVNLARQYTSESICSAGAVSPLATVSYLLAKRMHAPGLLLMTHSGGYVDVGSRPMLMTLAESLDFQTSVAHCGGDETYHVFYQPGHVTHEVVTAAQIDRFGRANNVVLTTPSGKTVRLPGQGGMADVANMHQNFILYVPRHSPLTLVSEVSYASAARGITEDDRSRRGWKPGSVQVFTDLCTFQLNSESGWLEIVALNPGVTLAQVAESTGFAVLPQGISRFNEPPTREELSLLRDEIDPLGFRRLEFVASKQRAALLQELIDSEEAGIAMLLANGGLT